MDSIFSRISFGVGRKNDEPVDHPVLDAIRDADFAPQRQLLDLAAKQLGTVGAGNHYVDLFEDEDGWVWIGVHFGSRGFGHKTASGFLALAQGLEFGEHATEGEMDSPPVLFARRLRARPDLHRRDEPRRRRTPTRGATPSSRRCSRSSARRRPYEVHNHHNFAWRENHFGTDVWVIRKGCTPAFPGQEGFVGATMGEPSVILRGVDSEASRDLLYRPCTAPGGSCRARRRRGRWAALGGVRRARLRLLGALASKPRRTALPGHPEREAGQARGQLKPGEIDFAPVQASSAAQGIELRGGAADEAPGAYKRLDAVLAAHGDTIEILHRLTPIGVAMAGADTFDPYKD